MKDVSEKVTLGPNNSLRIDNAKIMFRNFKGLARPPYNAEGDRNFNVVFSKADGEMLIANGWNTVKDGRNAQEKERNEPIENYKMEVHVEYRKGRPPRCVMISSRGQTELGSEEVGLFDVAEIKNADMIISGYNWDVPPNRGIKPYLKSIYITIVEDELAVKYAAMLEQDPAMQSPSSSDGVDAPAWDAEDVNA